MRRGGGRGGGLVEVAKDIDECVFEVSLFAVELGDEDLIFDHAAEDLSRELRGLALDADAAAIFPRFEEFDIGLEDAPIGE